MDAYKAYLCGLLVLRVDSDDLLEDELCAYTIGRADRGDTVLPLDVHVIRTAKSLNGLVHKLTKGDK